MPEIAQYKQLTEMAGLAFFIYDGRQKRLYVSEAAYQMVKTAGADSPIASAPRSGDVYELSYELLCAALYKRQARMLMETFARKCAAAPAQHLRQESFTTLARTKELFYWKFSGTPETPHQLVGLLQKKDRQQAFWKPVLSPEHAKKARPEDYIQQFSTILETMTDGFFAFDHKLRLSFTNPKTERMLGLKLKNQFGISLYELLETSPDKDFVKMYIEAFETQQTKLLEGFSNRTQRYVRVVAYPWPAGLAVLVYDINDIKQHELHLEKVLQEKNVLLAEVHHRVKNNLAIIQSLLAFQQESINHSEAKQHFQTAQTRIQAIALVHELLYKQENFSVIEAYSYIENLVSLLHKRFAGQQLHIHQHIDVNTGVRLHITKAISFGILLHELVSNSYKHGFAGSSEPGHHLYIELWQRDNEQLLVVQDDGAGCSLHNSGKPAPALGLTLAENMVMQLGGSIHFKQGSKGDEEAGLCVVCSFPPLEESL